MSFAEFRLGPLLFRDVGIYNANGVDIAVLVRDREPVGKECSAFTICTVQTRYFQDFGNGFAVEYAPIYRRDVVSQGP